ncbi:DUF3618 domain-containing protein [Actinoplanes sp. NPDC026670]|uniref:DUF3618 domain-containing protein n=1 Tax=Actinoplanes sp. NPDC026670 TaxID=3154700 RepID=UPI0033D7B5D0
MSSGTTYDFPRPDQPQQLHEEIAQTRAELGGTVEALAAKSDVKTRAKRALHDTTGRARRQVAAIRKRAGEISQQPTVRRAAPPAAAAILAAVLGTTVTVAGVLARPDSLTHLRR